MSNFDWKEAVRAVAPAIATALGGPLAGTATAALSNAVLGHPNGREDELSAALATASPDLLAKVKEADQRFELEMRKLESQDKATDVDNTKDARAMQRAALAQGDAVARRFVYEYATFVTGAALVYVFAITFFEMPRENVRFADTVLGFLLGTIMATIINYFFGSSSGSEHKTGLLASLLKKGDGN